MPKAKANRDKHYWLINVITKKDVKEEASPYFSPFITIMDIFE